MTNDEAEILVRIPVKGYLEYTLYRPEHSKFKVLSQLEIQDVLDCGDFVLERPDLLGIVLEET